MKVAPETRVQRWRRHWHLSWKGHVITAALVCGLLLGIWGISALATVLLEWMGRTPIWSSLTPSTQFVISGVLLILFGGAFLRARLRRRGHGLVTLLDLRFFFIEIASIIGGIVMLIRATHV